MNKKIFLLFFGITVALTAAVGQPVHWTSGDLSVTIDKYGYYGSLKVCGQELLQSKELYPVVSAFDYQVRTPQSVRQQHDTLFCLMDDDQEIQLRIAQLPQCLTLEVIACPAQYNSLTFGPVALTIDEVVGELVGVAQEGAVAFGMQALNVKTTGGIPQEAANAYSEKFYYQGHFVDGRPGYSLAATRIEGGTVFQLSGRNRGLRRGQMEVRHVGSCHASIATPVQGEEGLIVGTRVALFGCPRGKALEHIGQMEKALGLPHPTRADGTWVKAAPAKSPQGKAAKQKRAPYTVESVVEWDSPLTTTNLASHFQKQLMFQLQDNLGPTDSTIHLLTGAYNCFPVATEGYQVVRIDEELIRFRSAEDNDGHVTLSGCRRGAFGTAATAHNKFTTGCRLWTVKEGFVPDLELLDTLADRAVERLRLSSVRTIPLEINYQHLDYCLLTGQDEYAVARFVSRSAEQWTGPVVCRADYLTNFTWHYLAGVTLHGHNALPDMTDTTWNFLTEVPVHDHTHDHAHTEADAHEHHHEEHHQVQEQPEAKTQPRVVKEKSTMENFLKRNLLR